MPNHPDDCFLKFTKSRLKWKGYSEADTRVKIIDELFKGSLGWSEDDIVREEPLHPGYIDYVFKVDGIPRFVVEAKKAGKTFKIPIRYKKRKYKLNGIISKEKELMEAIKQAHDYCGEKGLGYGIVTNGLQYVIFESFVIGKDFQKGNCVIYRSPEDIEENFIAFWNTLSKCAVRSNSLRKALTGEIGGLTYFRPLDKVHNPDAKLVRNHLAGVLNPFIRYFFEEITEDSKIEVLDRCYIYEKSHENTNAQLKSFFIDQLPSQFKQYNIENFVEGEDTAGKFQVNFYKCAEYLRKDEPEGSLSLLLGGVGSGKTTFIHRFFKLVLYPEEKILWFYIDFRNAPTNIENFRNFILNKIVENYEKKYSKKLEVILSKFDLQNIDPTVESLTKLFTILKLLGYTISLIIDNVDQHYSLSPKIQHQVFLEAQNLTDSFKTVTILSLREESFFKSNLSGAFNAYYIDSFQITPPNFLELITRRLDFLLEIIEKSDEEISKRVKTRRTLLINEKKDIKDFFQIIKNSVTTSKGGPKHITRFIQKMAGSDMRRALELFNLFLISGNTKVHEMLTKYRRFGNYQIAYHQVIKSIVLGESMFYASNRSHVMNLFELAAGNPKSHFLYLKILKYARDRLQFETKGGRGYTSIIILKQEAEKIGVDSEAINDTLTRLARFKLILFDNLDPEKINSASYFKLTETGRYYLEELCHRFVYLDLMWIDTPISDEELEKKLRYMISKRDMASRFERTESFLEYLKESEILEFETNPHYYMSEFGRAKFMNHIIRNYNSDKRYITGKRRTTNHHQK